MAKIQDDIDNVEGAFQDAKKEITVKVSDLRNEYHVRDEVGRGKFGVVHKVINKEDGDIYAAKFIKVTQAKRKDVFREVEIMKKLNHVNLINLTDVYDMETRIIVIMEFISGGELFERVVEEDNLTESEAAIYMKQILEGLRHMHKKNIVHLDLKPENVVCVEPRSTRIKLIDFGLARQLDPEKETKITCGTPEFVAPEVLNFDPVTLASDMWSVGVIAYILLSGLSPFLGDSDSETFANVSACEWDFEDDCFDDVSKESKDFIEGLIVSRPRDRRNVDLCLEHDWIQNHSFKKRKKLRVDNLRKFLAKKRWQKSVNAVRAVRRLSSFGASLLGKTSSLLRDRPKLGSLDSANSSIAEDSEGPKHGEGKRNEELVSKNSSKASTGNSERFDLSNDIDDTREVNDSCDKAGMPNERKAPCDIPKASSKQGSREVEIINDNKPNAKKDNDSSRSLANISELRQKFETVSETFRKSRASSSSDSRTRSNSLDWDRKSEANEIGTRESKTVDDKESPEASRLFSNYHLEDSYIVRGSRLEKNSKLLERNCRSVEDLTRTSTNNCKEKSSSVARVPAEIQSNAGKVSYINLQEDKPVNTEESVTTRDCSAIEEGDSPNRRRALLTEATPARKALHKESYQAKEELPFKGEAVLTKGNSLGQNTFSRKESSSREDSFSNAKKSSLTRRGRNETKKSFDNDLERGCSNNKPPSDGSNNVIFRNSYKENGECNNEKEPALCRVDGIEDKNSKQLITLTKSEDKLSTEKELRGYLERMIKEGKLPGAKVNPEMPHKKSWANSSASAKRASFRELLSKSIAADEEEESAGSEDEEPIKITPRKDKFDDYFEDIEEIGKGRFGVVNKVREKATGKFYAAKYIKVRAATRCLVRQEIDLLCAVRHRKIVKLHDVFEESRRFILILEWVAGGELFEKLSKEEIISEKEAVFFVKQILQGVRCMHRKGILHLDLKPENVMLVDQNSTDIKIIDFGLAKRYNPQDEIKVLSGTPAFAAPEVINFEKITAATDMWSIGVIAYVLMSGISPFFGDNNQETCSNVTKAIWDFDHEAFDSISSEAKDFISKLMIKNPRKRMSVDESIDHPWIKNARKRRKSEIKTKELFRFTTSFSKSIERNDDVFENTPNPENGVRNRKPSITSAREIDEDQAKKVDKQSVFEVVNTMDESSTDAPTSPGNLNRHKNHEEYKVLEERFKNVERGYDEMKSRLRKQSEIQNEMESLRNELEKSLSAHQKLQDSLLVHEKEKMELTEKHETLRNKANKLDSENQELVQKLEIVNENHEKLNRKYKRLQEKLENNENLEDRIEELERTKARKMDKIAELEDRLAEVAESKRKTSRGDEAWKTKLEKENRTLQNTVEGCHQEIEELEDRLGKVERENTKLRKELKQWRGNGKVENNNKVDNVMKERVQKLEELKIELEEQIEIEIRDRKLAEKERDTIEEEFAEERSNLESRIKKLVDHNHHLEDEIREVTSLLDASKKSYFQLDEEFEDLKKERNFDKRKHNEELGAKEDEITDLMKEKETLKLECDRLEKKMAESIEEIRRLERDHSMGKGTLDRKSSGTRELERVKDDLKMTQDHLRIATDTNSMLQLEIKKLKKDHDTELNIQLIELEAKLSKAHEAEIDRVREELTSLPNHERKELEDRITVQDFAIRKLQAILELRENEEGNKEETQEIVPITMNGNDSPSPPLVQLEKRLPDSINVTISGHKEVNVASSIEQDDEDDAEDKETITDRELRRISYKIADGVWTSMGQALCLRGPKYEDIMGSSINDQEKIFRLLSLWKSEMRQPRNVMISQLTVAIERMKRRDIVKFVKELNGREGSSSLSIRKRIRNFVR